MLSNIIDQIMSNPILMAIAVILLVVILFGILKRLFKIAGFAFLIVIAFLAYVYFTSDNPRKSVQNLLNDGKEKLNQAKDKAKDVSDEVKKEVDKIQSGE